MFAEQASTRSDDLDLMRIVNGLDPNERSIWLEEWDVYEEMAKLHGNVQDLDAIVEEEIYSRGIEAQ